MCAIAAAQLRLHTSREADKFFTFLLHFRGRNCRTGGFPVHSHPREEELVQLLPFTFVGFDVLTSDASGEGVQLDPLAGYQLLLQGRHQQGPGTIHIANVVLLPEQRDLTTNANMILFKFAIYE